MRSGRAARPDHSVSFLLSILSTQYLYLGDRLADIILRGGANIYPAEVEAAVMAHPHVRSCVVVGLPDAEFGQRVHAILELAGDAGRESSTAKFGQRVFQSLTVEI